mmetsp:Transcript_3754/g.6936  ORF Transcript_3754/g.6936 Transcript_3754/m.6936 type:complete len:403 (-) Transcript_3754:2-1210(-)
MEGKDLGPPSVAKEPMSQNGSDAKVARSASLGARMQTEKVDEQSVQDKVQAGESPDAEKAKSKVQDHKQAPTPWPKRNVVKIILSMVGPHRGSKKNVKFSADIDETLHESAVGDSESDDAVGYSEDDHFTFDDSLVTIDDSLISILELASNAKLDTLVKEQEQESDEEVDELIKSVLIGFENKEIEKELQDQTSTVGIAEHIQSALASFGDEEIEEELQDQTSTASIAEVIKKALVGFVNEEIEKELQDQTSTISIADRAMSTGLQKEAEMFLANLVNRLDSFVSCGCGRSCRNSYDDASVAITSICSASGGRIQKSDIKSLNPSMGQLLALVSGDDDSLTLGTDYDDESLVSEYDDFNKAMLMLKNRAARHRLSEARLLDKVKMEQQRRQSIGLTPTMIEI